MHRTETESSYLQTLPLWLHYHQSYSEVGWKLRTTEGKKETLYRAVVAELGIPPPTLWPPSWVVLQMILPHKDVFAPFHCYQTSKGVTSTHSFLQTGFLLQLTKTRQVLTFCECQYIEKNMNSWTLDTAAHFCEIHTAPSAPQSITWNEILC